MKLIDDDISEDAKMAEEMEIAESQRGEPMTVIGFGLSGLMGVIIGLLIGYLMGRR